MFAMVEGCRIFADTAFARFASNGRGRSHERASLDLRLQIAVSVYRITSHILIADSKSPRLVLSLVRIGWVRTAKSVRR